MNSNEIERESREWWVIDGDSVVKSIDYSGAPDYPQLWYFPSLRFTGQIGHVVFETQEDATKMLKQNLTDRIRSAQIKLDSLS